MQVQDQLANLSGGDSRFSAVIVRLDINYVTFFIPPYPPPSLCFELRRWGAPKPLVTFQNVRCLCKISQADFPPKCLQIYLIPLHPELYKGGRGTVLTRGEKVVSLTKSNLETEKETWGKILGQTKQVTQIRSTQANKSFQPKPSAERNA